jgi:hypothetical protein
MTITELSAEFDILYNNITSNQAPGLSEYEKSVFLTQAQEAIVTELYNGNLKDSFESSEAYTRYLSSIVKSKNVTPSGNDNGEGLVFNNTSINTVTLDNDVLFVVYEQARLDNNTAIVTPTTHDTLYSIINNPFKGPNNRRVLRVSKGNTVELYYDQKYNLSEYTYRYVSRPNPIILEDLTSDTINGKDAQTVTLDVPEVLHRTILLRAVQLAKAVWQS